MRIKGLYLFLILTMILNLTACGPVEEDNGVEAVSSPVYNDIVKISIYEGIQSVDPAYAHNAEEIAISGLVFEGLVKNEDGEIAPSLAREWEVSEDGLTYTFYLRAKAYFHNGKEMTADDVKFSFERVLRQRLSGSYIFTGIVGADQVLSGESKDLVGITAAGDYTLKIQLNSPDSDFLSSLASPTAKVLDRLELVEEGLDFGRPGTLAEVYPLPSGTGPYRLCEWLDGKRLALSSYENYYGEAPYPERIEYTFDNTEEDALLKLRAGTVSIVKEAYSAESDLKGESDVFTFYQKPVRIFRYLAVNQEIPPFDNILVRKAVFDAISPTQMIKEARQGCGVCPGDDFTGFWYDLDTAEGTVNNGDLALAKSELVAAGYPGGAGLQPINLLCGPMEEDRAAAEYIRSQLAKIGITVYLDYHSYAEMNHLINEGSAAFYLDQYADKDGRLDIFFKERVDSSWQKTVKAGVWDSLLSEAYFSGEERKRELFTQVERELYDQGVLYCLYYQQAIVVTTDAYQGMDLDNDGSLDFFDIERNSRKSQ